MPSGGGSLFTSEGETTLRGISSHAGVENRKLKESNECKAYKETKDLSTIWASAQFTRKL